jgi:glycosyltransferase involved in cell wall biosynthesis
MTEASVSVVIPAFNEQRHIGRMLAELRRLASGVSLQVIVADNFSTDRTVALATENGADLVISAGGTVGAVRNAGVALATGNVLIFLDADVFPSEQWAQRLSSVVTAVASDELLVTGSWVSVPAESTWIERYWFKPLENGRNSHINSGHLIVSRALFERLNGFDEALRTGEDFDFSVRARSLGARIVDDASLRVFHEGYPKSFGEFFRREMWHGVGDYSSWEKFIQSKVCIVGFVLVHGVAIGAVLSILSGAISWLAGSVAMLVSAGVAAAFIRYRGSSVGTRVVDSFLYSSYFLARGLSFYAATLRSGGKKRDGSARH